MKAARHRDSESVERVARPVPKFFRAMRPGLATRSPCVFFAGALGLTLPATTAQGDEEHSFHFAHDVAPIFAKAGCSAAECHGGRRAVVYGAGFYGVFIASVLRDRQRLLGHLDRNPHVRDAASVSPVFDPSNAPDGIELVYAGLNPRIARDVLTEWQAETGHETVDLVFLDEGPV